MLFLIVPSTYGFYKEEALFMGGKGAMASRRLDFYLLVHGRYFISLLPPIGNQWGRSPPGDAPSRGYRLPRGDIYCIYSWTREQQQHKEEAKETQYRVFCCVKKREIRDLAAKKRRCTMVQRKITDYFPQ
ncbi:hypothetical protein TNCV_228531 [Trichonephila clavipes]|nr:hypothetical protein TNCV_228531 [Trichonephila clavipes]